MATTPAAGWSMWALLASLASGVLDGLYVVSSIFTGLFILLAWGYLDLRRLLAEKPKGPSWQSPPPEPGAKENGRWKDAEHLPGEMRESSRWLNQLLSLLFLGGDSSALAERIKEQILARLSSRLGLLGREKLYLNNLRIRDLSLGQVVPQIRAFHSTVSPDRALNLAVEHTYEMGDATFCLEGELGIGLGKFSTSFRLQSFTGTTMLRFDQSPTFKMMLTDLPRLALNLEYGTQRLWRLSSVLGLVMESLLRNHLVLPNYQPFLLLPTAPTTSGLLFVPVWKSARRFLRITLDCISLAPAALVGLEGGSLISAVLLFNGAKFKSDEQSPAERQSFPLHQHLAIPETVASGEELAIVLSLLVRRRRYSKRLPFACASLPLKSIAPNRLQTVRVSLQQDPQATTGAELAWADLCLYHSTDPQMVDGQHQLRSEWPHALSTRRAAGGNLSPSETEPQEAPQSPQQYLDGINWSNVKLAWKKFRKASSLETSAPKQFEVIIRELDRTSTTTLTLNSTAKGDSAAGSMGEGLGDQLGPRSAGAAGSGASISKSANAGEETPRTKTGGNHQGQLALLPEGNCSSSSSSSSESGKVPMQEILADDAGFEVLPEILHEEDMRHIRIQTRSLGLYSDMSGVSADIVCPPPSAVPARFAVWLEEPRAGPAVLYFTPQAMVFCHCTGHPRQAIKVIPLKRIRAVGAEYDGDSVGRRRVCLQMRESPDFGFKATLEMLGPLFTGLCAMQRYLSHRLRLESCQSSRLVRLGQYDFLSLHYSVGLGEESVVLPIGNIQEFSQASRDAEVVLRRLCRRAAMLVSSPPSPYEVQVEVGGAGESSEAIMTSPPDDLTASIKCLQRKSIPTPVTVRLSYLGVEIVGRLASGLFTFLPRESIRCVALLQKSWHTPRLTIRGHEAGELFEFSRLAKADVAAVQTWCRHNAVELLVEAAGGEEEMDGSGLS